MTSKYFLNAWAVGCALLLAPAFGQDIARWVSSTGSDSNACTRIAPCATFQGALSKTNSGGEVDVVDPGDYGPVTVSQSVTIDGFGMGKISTGSTSAIAILSGSVTIRNLKIAGGVVGINCLGGSGTTTVSHVDITGSATAIANPCTGQVIVIDSRIVQQGGTGINANGPVVIHNSTIAGAATGVTAAFASVMLDGVLITNCGTGVSANSPSTVMLRNSTITGNSTGLASSASGKIVSFVTNAIYNNITDGAPTSSVFQK